MSFANVGSFEPTFFLRKRKEGDYRLSREFATGCVHTGMTEASGKDSAGVPKGQMTVAQFLEMIADDRKVVR